MLELITAKTEGSESVVGTTLDELARAGAQRMIAAALQIEVDEWKFSPSMRHFFSPLLG